MNKTSSKRSRFFGSLARYIALLLLASVVVVPILWMVSTAFKTEPQTYLPDPTWIPQPISTEAFEKFWNIYDFGKMTMNSFITCVFSTIICVAASCLSGYGITRYNFRGKKMYMGFLLVTQMFPSVMMVVPFYAILTRYNLNNTLAGLIIVYAATNIAFCTWMMVSYFKTIPMELDEAARIDGANAFKTFWRVVLPLTLPGIASVAIFTFINGWNEYMYSAVLISKDALKTLTVGIVSLNTQYQVKWNDLMAASCFSCLPLIVIFVCFQRYFIAGMTSGAVKS